MSSCALGFCAGLEALTSCGAGAKERPDERRSVNLSTQYFYLTFRPVGFTRDGSRKEHVQLRAELASAQAGARLAGVEPMPANALWQQRAFRARWRFTMELRLLVAVVLSVSRRKALLCAP